MEYIGAEASIAGISNDHTEAATITPEAKPSSVLRICFAWLSLTNSTAEEPNIVPAKGNRSSGSISIVLIASKFLMVLQLQI